jgi:hypothetical protein
MTGNYFQDRHSNKNLTLAAHKFQIGLSLSVTLLYAHIAWYLIQNWSIVHPLNGFGKQKIIYNVSTHLYASFVISWRYTVRYNPTAFFRLLPA